MNQRLAGGIREFPEHSWPALGHRGLFWLPRAVDAIFRFEDRSADAAPEMLIASSFAGDRDSELSEHPTTPKPDADAVELYSELEPLALPSSSRSSLALFPISDECLQRLQCLDAR